jgi:uncharacterized protein YukE
MYTPSDIRRTARKINDTERDLRSSENNFIREIININRWWSGKASDSFVRGCNKVGSEINLLYSAICDLETGLRKLASEVERADDERKRIQEKKRLEQLLKNKNDK